MELKEDTFYKSKVVKETVIILFDTHVLVFFSKILFHYSNRKCCPIVKLFFKLIRQSVSLYCHAMNVSACWPRFDTSLYTCCFYHREVDDSVEKVLSFIQLCKDKSKDGPKDRGPYLAHLELVKQSKAANQPCQMCGK